MVNIFIPVEDPLAIAKILDSKRLGKQRVEAKQIINIITNKAVSEAWKNHPAVLMWKPYPNELKYYYNIMVKEWINRGYKNNMTLYNVKSPIHMPWFMYCKPVTLSHQASLLRKNYSHYHKFFKVPTAYMKRLCLWVVNNEKHLNEEQINILKKVNNQNYKKINIDDFTKIIS